MKWKRNIFSLLISGFVGGECSIREIRESLVEIRAEIEYKF
jgi:hypothetical protein